MVKWWFVPAVSLIANAGCGIDLPDEEHITEARVLGVRVVPAADTQEVAPRAELVAGEVAQVEVLAVDELGALDPARLGAAWFACPLGPAQQPFACLESAVPVTRDIVPPCPTASDGVVELPAPCELSGSPTFDFEVMRFSQLEQGFSMELTMVLSIEAQIDLASCSDALLRGDYDTPEGCLYTSYELSIGQETDGANRHPGADSFLAQLGPDTFAVEQGRQLTMARGQRLTLTFEPPPIDEEDYSIPVNNGDSFATVTEELSVRWFRTDGEFEQDGFAGLSDDEVIWTPGDSDAARLYALVRDGRGGLAWWWVDVAVTG